MREARKALLTRLKADFAVQLAGWLATNPEPDVTALDEKSADAVRNKRIGEILVFLEHGANATAQQAKAAYDLMHNERLAAVGKMWYFRMVGTLNAAQTFHGQMAASGYFANPLTMATGHSHVAAANIVLFEQGKTKPTGQNQTIFQNLLTAVDQDLRVGRQMQFQVTGCASGKGWGTDARRQSQQSKTAQKRADNVATTPERRRARREHRDVDQQPRPQPHRGPEPPRGHRARLRARRPPRFARM